jgi:hypothetical protein
VPNVLLARALRFLILQLYFFIITRSLIVRLCSLIFRWSDFIRISKRERCEKLMVINALLTDSHTHKHIAESRVKQSFLSSKLLV